MHYGKRAGGHRHVRDGRPAPTYPHWFDIVPEAIDTDECLPESGSYSSDLERFTSPAAARERMAEKATAALNEGAKLVREEDLPDAPSPPAGVERWYLVPPGAVQRPRGNPA